MKLTPTFFMLASFATSVASGALLFDTVIEAGDPAPGIANATIANVDAPVINDFGQVSLRAAITGTGINTGNDQVIFSGLPGALVPIAQEGNAAFGGPPVFNVIDGRLILTDTGETLFFGTLSGTGISAANDRFLAHAVPGEGTFKVAQEGDPIPGTTFIIAPDGLTVPITGPDYFAQNDGRVAFTAKLEDSAAPGSFQDAVIIYDLANGMRLVARTGDPAPGGGIFAPTGVFGPPLGIVGLGPDGHLVIEGSGTDGSDFFNGVFDAPSGGGPLTSRYRVGQPIGGVKKNRAAADLNNVVSSSGGLVIFDSTLRNRQTGEVLFDELVLAADQGPGSVPRAVAVRDTSAPGAGKGVVYSGFLGNSMSKTGAALFQAALFKKPNGLTPPKDMGVFAATSGQDSLFIKGGRELKSVENDPRERFVFAKAIIGLTGGKGPQELQAVLLADVLEGNSPAPNEKDALIVSGPDSGKRVHTAVAVEGSDIQTTGGSRTVASLPAPTAPMGSAGQARSGNQNGDTAVLVGFNGGGRGAFVFPSPRPPGPVRQPDIIFEDEGKFGDDIHQDKPANTQLQSRDVPVNTIKAFEFFIQNDGNVGDTIRFTSSGKDARDRLRWFLGDDDTTEISDDVFGEGRSFTLAPGARQKVRLVVQRQTLENKGKTDKVKMKAVSTGDKKKRDNFQITVNFKPAV
jgi:hypothetical protein